MTTITAQELFRTDDLPDEAQISPSELKIAFWEIKKLQRDFQQQQVFWRSLNESLTEAYSKLGTSREELNASREELRNQISQIQAQEETIRALATPIIQVWTRVLVLPIVGKLDAERASAIMSELLHAVVASQSSFVVLDLTGVKVADARMADDLLRIDRAVKFLGARCLLSGLSSSLALALSSLDSELGDLISFSTLHAALHHALLHMGELPKRGSHRPAVHPGRR